MKLFTKDIDQKLFDQYMMGNDLENQMVVAKIFNPYGNGVWYLLNSDPNDPDYLWAIVDLFEVEVGSVSREELETLKVPPFRLGLERDLYFTPMNAKKLYEALLSGEKFEDGGTIDIKKDQNGDNWVFPNNPQGESYGIKLAAGGMTAGRYYRDRSGQEFRYVGESQGKLLFKDGEKVIYKDESDFEEEPQEKRRFGFFAHGGKTNGKRYKVNVYYGGEMEDEEFYTDSLEEAERASQGGEHSEIYDNHKKEFVEIEYAKGGKLPESIGGYKIDFSKWREDVIATIEVKPNSAPFEPFYLKGVGKTEKQAFQNLEKEYNSMKKSSYVVTFSIDDSGWIKSKPISAYTEEQASNILYESASMEGDVSILKIDKIMARGGMFEFKPYGKTKGIYKIYYKAEGKPQTEIWETKEMAVNSAKRYASPQMRGEYTNIKVFDEDGAEVDYMSEVKYARGGEIEEDVYNAYVVWIDDNDEAFFDGGWNSIEDAEDRVSDIYYEEEENPKYNVFAVEYDEDYFENKNWDITRMKSYRPYGSKDNQKMVNGGEVGWKKAVTIGRPTKLEAQKNAKLLAENYGNSGRNFKVEKRDDKYVVTYEFNLSDKMAMGGTTKFKDKVQSIKASLLKRKKVSPKVQKDYGKTYSPKEAEESAKRIAGSMVKKEKRQPRVSKMLEKMKKGTEIKKKKSTFKDRMKDLSTKIKERKSKSTK